MKIFIRSAEMKSVCEEMKQGIAGKTDKIKKFLQRLYQK